MLEVVRCEATNCQSFFHLPPRCGDSHGDRTATDLPVERAVCGRSRLFPLAATRGPALRFGRAPHERVEGGVDAFSCFRLVHRVLAGLNRFPSRSWDWG